MDNFYVMQTKYYDWLFGGFIIMTVISFIILLTQIFNKLDSDIDEFDDENQIILPQVINDNNHDESINFETQLV